ncbi:restriction endonuclease [Micrococcus sp. IITD107]|uniref:restriction endonuclease n=1 Tax=Micrococcus sp. IITD107 TaxID=3342790 RepID=UPI0035BAE4A7
MRGGSHRRGWWPPTAISPAPNGNTGWLPSLRILTTRCANQGHRASPILVTLSRFTEPAKKAAIATTPTVDLVSGDRLVDLIHGEDGVSGVTVQPSVDESWFDRFDSVPG